MSIMGPPRIDVGYYPDGTVVQLLELGPGKIAEIPTTGAPALPHTRWMPVDVLGTKHWVLLRDAEFAEMQAAQKGNRLDDLRDPGSPSQSTADQDTADEPGVPPESSHESEGEK